MSVAAIELKGFQELKAAWAQAPEIVREELLRSMTEADMLLLRVLADEYTPKRTGHLRASIGATEQVGDHDVIGMVSTSVDYAIPVELGTRPHDIVAKPGSALHFVVGGHEVTVKRVHHPGTQGVHMFSRAFADKRQEVINEFSEGTDRIIVRLAGAQYYGA